MTITALCIIANNRLENLIRKSLPELQNEMVAKTIHQLLDIGYTTSPNFKKKIKNAILNNKIMQISDGTMSLYVTGDYVSIATDEETFTLEIKQLTI
ncbi:MAG: hypothetical protein U0L73_12505 [Ruminococcus bromii]|jgi:hypothetical protein|nr:hypothetical protein [Ruminococcus bromii]